MDILTFSVAKFYGKARTKDKKRTEKLEQTSVKLPLAFPQRILGPTVCWKIFYRQNEAFKWAQQTAEDVHVFAFEHADRSPVNVTGKRLYLATSLDVFWHYYRQLKSQDRHHYEIIPEGCPCKLYFDLEFLKKLNSGCDGDKMVDMLIQYVCKWLQAIFNIRCDRSDVLDLDASTGNKFSRHLIFQLPGAVFDNCISVGNFVRHIFKPLIKFVEIKSQGVDCAPKGCDVYKISDGETNQSQVYKGARSYVTEPDEGCPDVKNTHCEMQKICDQFSLDDLVTLLVTNKDGSKTLFCDLGVYTKNRNFRLYLSSKLNKDNPLQLSSQNQFRPDWNTNKISEEQALFNTSLISHRGSTADVRVLQFGCQEKAKDLTENMFSSSLNLARPRVSQSTDSLEGLCCSSPYPEIDGFIESLTQSHGCLGRIRRWTYFRSSDTLLYDIIGCRWCGRVQREHRSNNIMYLADLRRGVFYQKCYDPDCQAAGYKSQEKDIPHYLLPSTFFEDKFFDDEDGDEDISDGDDKLLLAATEEVEVGFTQLKQEAELVAGGGEGDDDDAMVAAAEVAEMYFYTDILD